MLIRNLKIVLRKIKCKPLFATINVLGLTVGALCAVLIFFWAKYELSYDAFHKNRQQIFAITQGANFNTVAPAYNVIKNEFPQITGITRVSGDKEGYIHDLKNPDLKVKIKNVLYASPEFNEIFTLNTLHGDLKESLTDPYKMVLSESNANKLFGQSDAIGQTIKYTALFPSRELELSVGAVVQDFPSNSSIQFEGLVSFATLDFVKPNGMKPDDNWRDGLCNMYMLVKQGTDISALRAKFKTFGEQVDKEVYGIEPQSELARKRTLGLVNLTDLHFFQNNRKQLVRYISLVGILIMVIAIINYINLSIAQIITSFSSYQVMKINGAKSLRLVGLIMSESVMYAIVAASLVLLFVWSGKTVFSSLLEIPIHLVYPDVIIYFLLFGLLLGVVSGIYPALNLVLGKSQGMVQIRMVNQKKHNLRQVMVAFQFVISIVLIACVFTIQKQSKFIHNKDLGFDNQQIVYAQFNKNIYGHYNTLKERLLENPNIKSVSGSQGELGQICVTLNREINGETRYFQELPVDPDFIATMGLELVHGRNFSWERKADQYQTLIVSESAVKAFESTNEDIIGTEVFMYDRPAKIIGVIKDFYFESFHRPMDPFMLYYHPGSIGTINIKLTGKDITETLAFIENEWARVSPDIPLEYQFLDKKFENLYEQDQKLSKILSGFSIITVLIACMGLFGLTAFTTVQRIKEIGVRKVNGAKSKEIIYMLNKEYVKWIAIAFIVAVPISYLAMMKWLQNFAYQTHLSWWIFALAGLLTMIIALITVSFQSWRAAVRNPVEALRYE